jgi:hypothetical protein
MHKKLMIDIIVIISYEYVIDILGPILTFLYRGTIILSRHPTLSCIYMMAFSPFITHMVSRPIFHGVFYLKYNFQIKYPSL